MSKVLESIKQQTVISSQDIPTRDWYDKILLNSTYKTVEIFHEEQKIANVPVENIH